jgi:hypothetical protein
MTALLARRWTSLMALALTLTLTGCASMQVHSYAGRTFDVTRYHTYAWAHFRLSTGDPRLDNNPFFVERLQAAVEKHLAARGFEKTDVGQSDLVIHYHASVQQRLVVNEREWTSEPCDNCGPSVYDAGTLLLDFVDARTNDLVWRGWAEHSAEGEIDSQEWMERTIDQAVERILARLPRSL